MYEPPKYIDLLDVVAGGNGTGKARGCGIDLIVGKRNPEFTSYWKHSYGVYWNTDWSYLIDGTFVPDSRNPSVQLDSAGHSFDGFGDISDVTGGPIWARAAEVTPQQAKHGWIHQIGRCPQFTPAGRGLLAFNPCAGITFDLSAVRRMYKGVKPARFQAVVGMANARQFYDDEFGNGLADVWVFVDGVLKFKRLKFRPEDGAIAIDVELGPNDRFLTLVSTDGGNSIARDWVVLGDPALKMIPTESGAGNSAGEESHQSRPGKKNNADE